jgi:oligopeptidase B
MLFSPKSKISAGLLALLAISLLVGLACGGGQPVPPVAQKIPKVDTFLSEIRTDNYFWLRDKENPEVISYLETENEYIDQVLKHTDKFQDDMYEEILGRIKETDMEVPYKLDDYYYYTRTEEGKQYSITCRKKGSLDAPEEIILDRNVLAEGRDFLGIGAEDVSPDHNLLAYAQDTTGAEVYTIYIKNLETGELLDDIIENVSGNIEWANDNQTLFYSERDEANRPYKLFRHKLGTSRSEDVLVYHEPDDGFWLWVWKTKSRKYLIMGMGAKNSDERWYLDADNPTGEFKLVHARQDGLEYDIEHHGDLFYITTNDNARNFKLMKAPTGNPVKKNWKEVIGHREAVKIDNIDLFKNHMVIYERENGLTNIHIMNLNDGKDYYMKFPEPVYTARGNANPDFNTNLIRYTYYSLVTPRAVYDFDMDTRDQELKKQREVLGGYDQSLYKSERIFAKGHDGTEIPISMVYKRDQIKTDGANPLYLYVYGAYGHSMDPYFSSSRLSLMNRGFIFAIAHVRGGGEMGRFWYDEGKMLSKKNTFKDLISCAEYLINQKYTSADKLVTSGGSAGGLTVGVAMNMRPDLFEIVIADVPFVDIVNTMMDPTIPLTVPEYQEWGNPNIQEYYDYMRSYSPYDNVTAQAYPTILITTSLNDSRVQYWEPAKWTAKLRDMKTDDNLLLLKTNMGAGHGGASGRYDYLKDIAFEYVFILDHFGIHE